MGKNKKMRQDVGGRQHSPATVFVSNLPYTFTNSQATGRNIQRCRTVRRCFMVTQKGSTKHRGFAFVQFAVTEDAKLAIELKSGSSVGGRTIGVKQAMHRAPLEQRQSKGNEVILSDDTVKAKYDNDNIADDNNTEDGKVDTLTSLVKHKPAPDTQEKGKKGKKKKTETPLKTKHVEDDSSTLLVKHKLAPDTQEKGKKQKPKIAVTPLKTEDVEGDSLDSIVKHKQSDSQEKETFTTEHHPIVEFALDNIQTLRQRNDKIEAQQKGFINDAENENRTDLHKPIDRSNDLSRKRKIQKVAETESKPAKKKLMGSNESLEAQHEGKKLKGRFTALPGPMSVVDVPNKKRSRLLPL